MQTERSSKPPMTLSSRANWTVRLVVLNFTILSANFLYAQSIQSELVFARHLATKKNYDEAHYVLISLSQRSGLSPLVRDSIHYLQGKTYYEEQLLQKSIQHFDSVSDLSAGLKTESVFFSSFNNAYLHSYSTARTKLTSYSVTDTFLIQLKNFEMAGIHLLERDLLKYDSLAKFFSLSNYSIAQQQKKFEEHHQRILNQPKKSRTVAAVLSAILPGAGKFYAGNKGQGFYTFLIAGVLGLQTWEGYHKSGISSPRFIIYGALFSSFYIGTIWGSSFAVKLKRDQLNETINSQILFDMHIPLRTIFH
jgi:hypothetical protein